MENLFVFLILASLICLVVGLIRPAIFSRLVKQELTRKKIGLIFGGVFIVSFVLLAIIAEPVETATQQEETIETEETQPEPQPENTGVLEATEPIAKETPEPQPEVYEKISAMTNCAELQAEFDLAEEHGNRNRENGKLDLAEISTDYMRATDERMQEIGCYKKQQEETTDEATLGEKNALSTALGYLSYSPFSYSGLVKQLEYEGYTNKEAVYGADNCGADWNEQASLKAQEYLNYSAFSRDGLITQLEYEGFTRQQAEYGVQAVGY